MICKFFKFIRIKLKWFWKILLNYYLKHGIIHEIKIELKQFLDIMTKHYVLHLPVNLSMLIHYKTTKWPPLDYNEQKTVPWIIYCGFTLKGHQAPPWSLLICQRLIGLGFVYFSSSAKKRCTRWQIVVNWNQLERAVYPFVDL